MKKIFIIMLLFVLIGSSIPAVAETKFVMLQVDGIPVSFPDSQPFIDENGRTQVPVGSLANILGVKTDWESQIKTAYIIQGDYDSEDFKFLQITIGDDKLYVGNKEVVDSLLSFDTPPFYNFDESCLIQMDTSAILKEDRVFIPISYVAEFFNYEIKWDGSANCVNLYTKTSEEDETTFEFELFSQMPKDKNYMVSPFSLKMALAMAANGADGETKDEMINTLEIPDLDTFNKSTVDFIASSNKNESVLFNIANSIWHNTDSRNSAQNPNFGFSDSYKKTINDYFNGTASNINNKNGAETINGWIAKQTNDKIKNVIDDQMVEKSISFLVNTIYFKGDWSAAFEAKSTRNDTFTDRNGKVRTIAFMNDTGYYSYFENENIQMLAKPYKDNNIKMYFVLPKDNKPIQASVLNNVINNMSYEYIWFKVPKFKTEYLHTNLIDILKDMGIETAFSDIEASFSKMYSQKPYPNIYI